MPNKRKTAVIAVTLVAAVMVVALLMTHRSGPPPLSLIFQRYGTVTTIDLTDHHMAFLWLTNSTDENYLFSVGGTNTDLPDEPPILATRTPMESSYMARWQFKDRTPTGHTSPTQPVSAASMGEWLVISPHGAVRLRVALPPDGQKRGVGVLCMAASRLPGFWGTKIGGKMLLFLPRSMAMKILNREPPVLEVWCERELSQDPEPPRKR